MKTQGKRVLVCSCEGTMAIDAKALGKGLDGEPPVVHSHLCRSQIDNFRDALADGTPVMVACTQEAPLFSELAAETAPDVDLGFVNIRESAGWSDAGVAAAPAMAALIAEAVAGARPAQAVPMVSDGSVLICGSGAAALDLAKRLAPHRAVTCLLRRTEDALMPASIDFALCTGRVEQAEGHLGAFCLTVADCATYAVSARRAPSFEAPAARRTLEAAVVIDLDGDQPLFTAPLAREGYLRVEAGDRAGMETTFAKALDLSGEFEKPRYVRMNEDLCAHRRNEITGCTRCLDACPSGAVRSNGDHVAVDPYICLGHGACAAVCPTGAIAYDVPAGNSLLERLRVLTKAFRAAGGEKPVLLVHDQRFGREMIDLLARTGPGLPAGVVPFAVNEVTALGPDTLLSALAYGIAEIRLLAGPEQRDHLDAVRAAADLAETLAGGLGYGAGRVAVIEPQDPDGLRSLLDGETPAPVSEPSLRMVMGGRREATMHALAHLHAQAPAPVEVLELPAGSPFGEIRLDGEACTLCLSCVSVCPTKAIGANPDRPMVTFQERDCVQCGLCKATCPEKALSLHARLDFTALDGAPRVLKEEDPYECVRCGKPFGVRASIEKMVERLKDHSMFREGNRLEMIRMCDDCRIKAQFEDQDAPMAAGARPRPRTSDDYLH